jgi:hypothetical protein
MARKKSRSKSRSKPRRNRSRVRTRGYRGTELDTVEYVYRGKRFLDQAKDPASSAAKADASRIQDVAASSGMNAASYTAHKVEQTTAQANENVDPDDATFQYIAAGAHVVLDDEESAEKYIHDKTKEVLRYMNVYLGPMEDPDGHFYAIASSWRAKSQGFSAMSREIVIGQIVIRHQFGLFGAGAAENQLYFDQHRALTFPEQLFLLCLGEAGLISAPLVSGKETGHLWNKITQGLNQVIQFANPATLIASGAGGIMKALGGIFGGGALGPGDLQAARHSDQSGGKVVYFNSHCEMDILLGIMEALISSVGGGKLDQLRSEAGQRLTPEARRKILSGAGRYGASDEAMYQGVDAITYRGSRRRRRRKSRSKSKSRSRSRSRRSRR